MARQAANTADGHNPVMAREVLAALSVQDGGIYVDGTFGAGGYSRLFLQAANCTVVAIDCDPAAAGPANALQQEFPGRMQLIVSRFGDMARRLPAAGFDLVDGVAFDLGVSSMQLDQAGRGFSFQEDGPLDMRMSSSGPSAADAVNRLDQEELAAVIYRYGDERKSRRIAKAIVLAREAAPITGTLQLARIVAGVLGGHAAASSKHPATRTFQALRIYVNDELRELANGLSAAELLLKPAGRLAIVSFHSLEDRIVKQFFMERTGGLPNASRHRPSADELQPAPSFKLLWNGARKPGATETARNHRARSARLRAAIRTGAAPFNKKIMLADVPEPLSTMHFGRT